MATLSARHKPPAQGLLPRTMIVDVVPAWVTMPGTNPLGETPTGATLVGGTVVVGTGALVDGAVDVVGAGTADLLQAASKVAAVMAAAGIRSAWRRRATIPFLPRDDLPHPDPLIPSTTLTEQQILHRATGAARPGEPSGLDQASISLL
ncbi:MAG: hypothetical protein ACYDGN_07055 [Acidimicrobiales bacterium]